MLSLGRSFLRFAFSGGHGHSHHAPPTRLQRVDQKIIWLNVKNTYGEFQRVAAFQGQSLTKALVRSRVQGVQAKCQGRGQQVALHERPGDPYTYGPGCKSCTVIIRSPWKQQIEKELGKMEYDEKNLLMESEYVDADMRVGCMIPITNWMKEMNVTVVDNVDDDV